MKTRGRPGSPSRGWGPPSLLLQPHSFPLTQGAGALALQWQLGSPPRRKPSALPRGIIFPL